MNYNVYGVKLIYKHSVIGEHAATFYEEQIVRVKAVSFDEAYEKAEKYAEDYFDEYMNVYGDKVRIELYEATDCFLSYDEESDVQEVYSGFYNLSDSGLKEISMPCNSDELFILRRR